MLILSLSHEQFFSDGPFPVRESNSEATLVVVVVLSGVKILMLKA
jgi:hypothetical protein